MLRHTRALVLHLGGGLADLPLEGSEEVLAKLLGHICLQVGLHEEAEALVVDGLGSGQRRRRMEVPQATMEVPQATMKVQSCLWVWGFMPWAPLTGHSSCRALPRTAGFPNPSGWR